MNISNSIYLDYASTSPRKEEVMRVREEFEKTAYANIGRGNYDLAEQSMLAYQNSKKTVAQWIGCEPVEVLYTYSATYAINLLALAIEQNQIIGKGDTILLSVSEHHANIVPWQMMAERVWARVKFVTLDNNYCIDLADLKNKLDDSVKIVSLQYASNVTGAIHPLEEIRAIIWMERLFFVDATQMILHGPISMRDIQCDALVFSGHKIMADTGIGVLALWKVLQKAWQSPIGWGGAINRVSEAGYEQAGIPERWEPGTPHITGAVTLGAAINYLEKWSTVNKAHYQSIVHLVDSRFSNLTHKWITLYHSQAEKSLWVWSFVIRDKHSSDVADLLAEQWICVRPGHHCCEPLHISWWASGTVRVSIGFDTTEAEIERFFAVLESFL